MMRYEERSAIKEGYVVQSMSNMEKLVATWVHKHRFRLNMAYITWQQIRKIWLKAETSLLRKMMIARRHHDKASFVLLSTIL